MTYATAALLFLLNFGISWWNAYACGRAWVEANHVGGFIRIVVWAGAVQSACGFTICFAAVFGCIGYLFGYLSKGSIDLLFDLTYLLVIVPVLGSGLIITIQSWLLFARDRSLLRLGVGSYNTFATTYNASRAISGVPKVLADIFSKLGGGNDKGKNAGVIILMLLAASAGILLTAGLIRHYSGTVPLPANRATNIAKSETQSAS